MSVRWVWNGYRVPGATGSVLATDSAQPDYSGTIQCEVTNGEVTVASDPAELVVLSGPVAPVITRQPASVTAPAGSTVAMSVAAAGTPSLSYQWYLNVTTPVLAVYGGHLMAVGGNLHQGVLHFPKCGEHRIFILVKCLLHLLFLDFHPPFVLAEIDNRPQKPAPRRPDAAAGPGQPP